jgi:hypothetical protein
MRFSYLEYLFLYYLYLTYNCLKYLYFCLHVFRYLTAFILLWKLNNEVDLFSWNIIEDGGVIRYLKSGWSISLMLIQGFFI